VLLGGGWGWVGVGGMGWGGGGAKLVRCPGARKLNNTVTEMC